LLRDLLPQVLQGQVLQVQVLQGAVPSRADVLLERLRLLRLLREGLRLLRSRLLQMSM
jgi:hypothetical protein